MQRDRAYIQDILDAARLAMSYLDGLSEEDFAHDTQIQDAVIRRIEIIGEAARRVSPQVQRANLQIPWSEMIGMRNLMIHDYDDVDVHVVWNTVQQDLPQLIVELAPLLTPE
jgi:uncharacterized protein with HEPN domain